MKSLILSSLLFVSFQLFYSIDFVEPSQEWTYKGPLGPSKWKKRFPKCGRKKQSPINIPLSKTKYSPLLRDSIEFNSYSCPCEDEFLLENKGTTLEVNVATAGASIKLKDLDREYNLEQFQFHWGKKNSRGSEHRYSGKVFSAEMHLVHYNVKYSSLVEALDKPDGLAVLAVMIKIGKHNPAFDNFLKYIDEVIEAETEVEIPAFSIKSLLPSNTCAFYRYQGSLTTPPCFETVIWTLFATPIEISRKQINLYRKLKNHQGKPLVHNFRPIQRRRRRIVKRSFCRVPGYHKYYKHYKDD